MGRTKFNVDKDTEKRTYDGIVFDSILEMKYYRDVLCPLVKSGDVVNYELQKPYELQPKFIHDNKTVQPSIFCIIEQPNDAQYKVWGFRAEYNQLNSYIKSARKTKNNGATVLNIYYCYSANMGKMASSPRDLRGVGAQDYNTLLSKVSRIIGEQISQDNFKLAQTITL